MSRWVQVQSAFIYPKATKFEKTAFKKDPQAQTLSELQLK